MLCCAMTIFAQNDKISYQAVVRDTANRLVANKNVEVTVNIFNVTATTAAYTETQAVTANYNGLISLLIGPDGNNAGWNSIQWNKARIETTVKLDGTELGTLAMPLTAVPYAVIDNKLTTKADADNVYSKADMDQKLGAKADTAILAKVAKTGSYSDLSGKPEINNVTLTLKQGNATLGTFTANASQNQEIVIPTQAILEQVNSDWNATSGAARILLQLVGGDARCGLIRGEPQRGAGHLSRRLACAERRGVGDDDGLCRPKRLQVQHQQRKHRQGAGLLGGVEHRHVQLCGGEHASKQQRDGLFRRSGRQLLRFVVRQRGQQRQLLEYYAERERLEQRIQPQPELQQREREQGQQQEQEQEQRDGSGSLVATGNAGTVRTCKNPAFTP